ncbi:MAG: ATP-binding protein, partial [Candidatus Dormibacteraceae bacterium]
FIEQECHDPTSILFSSPDSTLMAEFPSPDQARRVLEAVGSGNRTQANIASAAGGRHGPLPSGSLSPLLHRLVEEKQILAIDEPLSTVAGKPALYRIADTNLQLFLAALRSAYEQVRRGLPQAAFRIVERRWKSWRGRAIEPLIRHSLTLALASGTTPWSEVEALGGWWNRQFDPEVDLVGADRSPVAQRIFFAGSIKWLGTPFDKDDLAKLAQDATRIPGFTSDRPSLAIVSLSGTTPGMDLPSVDLVWGPDEVIEAWRLVEWATGSTSVEAE